MSHTVNAIERIDRCLRNPVVPNQYDADAQAALAAVDALHQATKTGLHSPPDGIGEDGVTVHRWEPGHPMGCPICIALDRMEGDHA
jgi:hypothetical protein